MSYQALYRKWRPTSFDEVKGQDPIVKTLKNQVISDRIGHAYLFCGTRGTGKTSIAKIFARAVNCEHPVDGSPCGTCVSCQQIAANSSLNVVEIDAASNNGVDNIRDIRDQVEYPPTEGRYRVYIIDEVHMLSIGAFNALLKTLEEPPSYVIFILATTEAHKIPITIHSRCQRYDFKRISLDTIEGRLKELAEYEGLMTEPKALRYVARAADGSMRDALSLLDQCVAFHFGETLTYDNVLDVLGAVDTSVFHQLLQAILQEDTKACIAVLEDMVMQGRELGQMVNDFVWYLRNLLLVMTTDGAEDMVDMSSEHIQLLKEEAGHISLNDLMRFIRIFSELSGQVRYATQKRVLIEIALIKLTKPAMETGLDAILQRLSTLETKMEQLPEQMEKISASMPVIGSPLVTAGETGKEAQPETVVLPKAQYDDLMLIRNEWHRVRSSLIGSANSALKDTVVEPSGESILTIVCFSQRDYDIIARPNILEELTQVVETRYQKQLEFKVRLEMGQQRVHTNYVSDEDFKEAIQMEVSVEEDGDDSPF